jgi:2,3-bisphosphoglycerate-dependent phosphoglycerate mutase
MTRTTRIGWVRHGVTEWNQLGKIQGATDIPLSPEGTRQAERLAERLAKEDWHWDGVLCSDLQRAKETGRILADRLRIPLVPDPRLRERYFGEAEGTTESERLKRWGKDWRRLVPDQETDAQIEARGQAFVTDFAERHSGESWLVVSHGSYMARVMRSMCEELEDSPILNMSLTIMEQSEWGWIPLLRNCTLHLNETKVN